MSDISKKDWKRFKDEHAQIDDENLDASMIDVEDNEGGYTGTQTKRAPEELEHLDYDELEAKLTESEQKAHQYWDKATRAMAELENVRRRAERDVTQAHLYSLERFVKEIIPVIDSLEQALQLVDEHADQAMYKGLSLTMTLFLSVMAKFQVVQLDPLNTPFNPQEHEAMSMQESDQAANSVIKVFQKGYKLNDRVIRPARVIVAK